MQYDWSKYETAIRHSLANPEFGFTIMAENAAGEAVGFVSVTFEWSDWRNAVFFWMQGLQIDASCDEAAVVNTLKTALDAHKATLEYPNCGIRLCTPKVLHTEAELAIRAFDLKPSHYYVYHIDTE